MGRSEESIKLVRPIFERLVEAFDKELNAVALQRESELLAMGISLYSDRVDAAGYPYKGVPCSRRSHRHGLAMPA